MNIKVNNEKELGMDIMKFIKDRNSLKFKKFSLDYEPIFKKIEKELKKINNIERFQTIQLLLIPAKHSYAGTDCFFYFKVQAYNRNANSITLKYINC